MGNRSSSKKKPSEPTKDEILARITENRDKLRAGAELAKTAFKVEVPTFDQSIAMAQILDSGVDKDLVDGLMAEAIHQAEQLGAKKTDTTAVVAIFDILLDDDEGQEHLDDAAMEAKKLFGVAVTHETVLDVYYQIYGEDDPV